MITIEIKVDAKSANEIKALLRKIGVKLGLHYGGEAITFNSKGIKGIANVKDDNTVIINYKFTDGIVEAICNFVGSNYPKLMMIGKTILTLSAELKKLDKEWCSNK